MFCSSLDLESRAKWRMPERGFYKLNVDGRWKGVADAGGGGVIRSDTGAWIIGFSATYRATTSCVAELLAIKDGLIMARDHGIQLLELETDAKNLKHLIAADIVHPNQSLLPIINDVAALIKRDWVVIVNHIPRAANEVAHQLARLSLGLPDNHTVHLAMPDYVATAFRCDLENAGSTSSASASVPGC